MTVDGRFLIGIPTYNGWKRVDALLNNLRQRTPADIKHTIVVCDDSGKDQHRKLVRGVCGRWGAHYIENQANRGVPASWNALARSVPDHDYVILLNDDVLVDNGWLRPLGYALSRNPKVGSFGVNCLYITESDTPGILAGPDAKVVPLNVHCRDGRTIRDERFDQMPQAVENPPIRYLHPAGCFFGFQRRVYDEVGGFDERYFSFYEEMDFGVSCAQRGFPSFGLSAPWYNYHISSATFSTAPEIRAGQIIEDSRRKFLEKWGRQLGRTFSDPHEIRPILVDSIPAFEVRWLGLDGSERVNIR